MMYRLARRAAFRLDPERAHRFALTAVRHAGRLASMRTMPEAPVTAFGLRFRNPVGLAAGYDKDATSWRGLASLGFGHLELGTVTPLPQPGNPKPRLRRIPEHGALVNKMGFPSAGAEAVARRLGGERPHGVVLGVSIGPNRTTRPEAWVDDYRMLADTFAPLADYLAVNVSSPNTPGLRDLETAGGIGPVVEAVVDRCQDWEARLGRPIPVVVKLSPDVADPIAVVAPIDRAGASGIVVGNTTTSRPDGIAAGEDGGLSGAPLGPLAGERLRSVLEVTDLPVVACGGIMSPEDAADRLEAGAALVQVYTGLVYEGPGLIRRIVAAAADAG
jgi:dihydroorotate dehydrogenase